MAYSSDTNSTSGLLQVSISPEISIFYTISGSLDGSKPVVLLSNSLAATTHLWDDFDVAFQNAYTVIRYDSRFHGQSPLTLTEDYDYHKGHSIEDLVNDVVQLLGHLQIKKLKAFIGLSIGAAIALTFGARCPERVEHVFVVGSRAKSTDASNAALDERVEFGRKNGIEALGRQSVERWFTAEWRDANPAKTTFVEDIVTGQSILGFEATIAALKGLDLWPSVDNIAEREDGSRFVYIVGEWDGVLEESRALAARSGSEHIIIEGGGHIINIQQPEAFHAIIRRALK